MSQYRIERDSMGEMRVPAEAMYGAQTARAVENFPVSGLRFPRVFIKALGRIKTAAAEVNVELGRLDATTAEAIRQAAEEVAEGRHDGHFPLDIFQTGSGTSTNMKANEVIAQDKSTCWPSKGIGRNHCMDLAGDLATDRNSAATGLGPRTDLRLAATRRSLHGQS